MLLTLVNVFLIKVLDMNNHKKPRQLKYLQDLIDLAGSTTKLAAQLNLHAVSVEYWRKAGVPQKYWDQLFELYGITPAELNAITRQCRKAVLEPSRTN